MSNARDILNDIDLTNEIINVIRTANKAIIKIYSSFNKEIKIIPPTRSRFNFESNNNEGLKKCSSDIPIVSEKNESSLLIPQKK